MPSRVARIVGWSVGAAVVLGGACVAYESLDARATRAAAASAWSAYGTCLVGEPLAAGQTATERLRAIDLGLLVATEAQRGDWPARCGRHASELADLLAAVSRRDARWMAAAQAARVAGAQVDPGRVDPATVDALSAALAALPLPRPERPSDGPLPPPAAKAELGRASLVELGRPGVASLAAIDPPSGSAPVLAFGGHPARVCRFDASLATARCLDAPHAADDAQIIPVPSDAPGATALRVLFTRDAPAGVVRVESGERVADDWNAPAFVRADGVAWTLAPGHAASTLRRGAEDMGIAIAGTPSASALAEDGVVWVDAAHRLHARDLDADGSLGPVADLGPLPPGEHVLALCRAAGTARPVLAVRATTGDQATTVFRVDRTWSTPVASARADRPATLSCHASGVALAWLDQGVVHRIACTPAGCTRADAPLGADWSGGESDRAVADLAGRVLVVRLASRPSATGPEPVQALVARFAPLEGLASAPDRVLLADAAHGGIDAASVQVFPRSGAALVVVTARDGTAWAARVTSNGELGAVSSSAP